MRSAPLLPVPQSTTALNTSAMGGALGRGHSPAAPSNSRSNPAQSSGGGLGPDPRPILPFHALHSLDLVLWRAATPLSGVSLDARLVEQVRHACAGLTLDDEDRGEMWADRVGILQLPSFVDNPLDYSPDNITVTEATFAGVQTRSLRAIMEGSVQIVVRRLTLGKHAQTAAAASSPSSPSSAAAAGFSFDDDDSSSDSERLAFLQRFYSFAGPIVNRPWGQCMDRSGVEGMFRWLTTRLRGCDASSSPTELARMERLLERHEVEYPVAGGGGRTARGIPFHQLMSVFRDMAAEAEADEEAKEDGAGSEATNSLLAPYRARNTFSDAELVELVQSFTLGDADSAGRPSLSNRGFLSKADFLTHWRASLTRTLPLRRRSRELLSGAFVSAALQAVGALPQGAECYFLPGEFLMRAPPAEGWEAHWRDWEAEADASAANGSGNAAARGGGGEQAASSAAAVGVRIGGDGSGAEGAAISRMHAHGVARVGVEHRLPALKITYDEAQPRAK